MSADIIAKHVQTIHEWLKSVMDYANLQNQSDALAILRATLHELRDHLPAENSAHLSAQLPMIIRGIYFESWNPRHVPIRDRKRDDFIANVATAPLSPVDIDVEEAVKGVLFTLEQKISAGEVAKIKTVLAKELKALWDEASEERFTTGAT